MTTKRLFNCCKSLIFMSLLMQSYISFAQYDTIHYFPPFYARSSEANELGRNTLFLSTNHEASFNVTIRESNGNLIGQVNISKTNAGQLWMGYQYDGKGIIDSSELNMVLSKEGIIATAPYPFFANMRHSSGMQAMSVTGKGNWGMGTHFRSGHLYSTKSNVEGGQLKSHMISVMATENNTTVKFSDFKDGVIFHGTATSGNTTDDITVKLNKYESYVIGAHLDEPLATGNEMLLNGILIESNLPIVVNSGSWCGGSNLVDSNATRDIGMDQILPQNMIGSKYIVTKRFSMLEEECERVIVIADYDNTRIYINGNQNEVATLNEGDFYIIPAAMYDENDIMSINSSNPVYVYQSTNASPDFSYTQCMNFVPPLECSGIHEITLANVDFFNQVPVCIDVFARKGSHVFINGLPISNSALPVTGNDDWEVYKLSNMIGTVSFTSDDLIHVSMLANSGAKGAAGYFTGFGHDFTAEIQAVSAIEGNVLIEDCNSGMFIITKDQASINEDVKFYFSYSGNAQNSIDYVTLPSSIIIPAGRLKDTLFVKALADNFEESDEQIIVTIVNDKCGGQLIADTLVIRNYAKLNLTVSENQFICSDKGEYATLFVEVEGGILPYTYQWSSGLGNSPKEIVYQMEQLSSYFVSVIDGCQQNSTSSAILVYNLCTPTVPNLITANGDGINDQFYIENLEDFPGSQLIIQNRWGNVVYQSDDYDNSWDASNIVEGTYFYQLILNLDFDGNTELEDLSKIDLMTGFFEVLR